MTTAVVCFGEVLVRLSSPGKELLLQSPRFDAHVGGAEANVAVSLSRLGHRSAVVSALPDSPLGRSCADELRRHGVNIEAIRFREGRMGLYFYTHGSGHRPAEVLYDRSESAFATAAVDEFDWPVLLQQTRWLHLSGITPAVSHAGAEAALRSAIAARKAGVKVSFDCNFRERVWGARKPDAPRLLRQLCEQADLIFGNDRDIGFMLGSLADVASSEEKYRRSADAAFRAFPHLQFIACTDRGRQSVDVQQLTGILQTRNETCSTRAFALHGIVDRIGAGDAFAAGVLHGLLSGFETQRIIDFGTAAACLKHSIPGDFNLAGVADVDLVLSEQRVDIRR